MRCKSIVIRVSGVVVLRYFAWNARASVSSRDVTKRRDQNKTRDVTSRDAVTRNLTRGMTRDVTIEA